MFDFEENAKLRELAKEAEWYETPDWAADAVLRSELLTPDVVDPCAGRGVLGAAARRAGYITHEFDLNDWPGARPAGANIKSGVDFLRAPTPMVLETLRKKPQGFTVMMNPPFSLACHFVDRSFQLGARKVLMFQRFSFLESRKRREFYIRRPPARIWLCGDRATCWRGDVPEEDIEGPDGKVVRGRKGRSVPTAHAWFVWERDHKGAEVVSRIWKDD